MSTNKHLFLTLFSLIITNLIYSTEFYISAINNKTSKNLILRVGDQVAMKIPAHKTVKKLVNLPTQPIVDNNWGNRMNRMVPKGSTMAQDLFSIETSNFNPVIKIETNNGDELFTLTFRRAQFSNDDVIPKKRVATNIFLKKLPSKDTVANWAQLFFYSGDKDQYGIKLYFVEDEQGHIKAAHDELEMSASYK